MLNPILVAFKSRDLKNKIMKEKRNLPTATFKDVNTSMVFVS